MIFRFLRFMGLRRLIIDWLLYSLSSIALLDMFILNGQLSRNVYALVWMAISQLIVNFPSPLLLGGLR